MNPSEALVLLDNSGHVLDVHYSSPVYNNALDYIRSLMTPGRQVRELFNIPDGNLQALCFDMDDPNSISRDFTNRVNAITFKGEEDEFHTLLPMAMVRLARFDPEKVMGIVRLSSFFAGLQVSQRQPLFCVDDAGLLIGFNRAFLSCFPPHSSVPLNRPVREFMDPTPEALQKQENRERLPVSWKLRCRMEKQSLRWEAGKGNGSFLTLPCPADPVQEDLLLRVETGEADSLPCVIIGDAYGGGNAYPDLDGYLFGPNPGNTHVELKKRGKHIFRAPVSGPWPAGAYEFTRNGNAFYLDHDRKNLFYFHDFEGLVRGPGRIVLHLRQGAQACVRSVELHAAARERPVTPVNRFTLLKNPAASQCHVERLSYGMNNATGKGHGVFRLRDMSDVRRSVRDLEENYRAVLAREQEAARLLMGYREIDSGLVGNAKALMDVKALADKAAESAATVLITGETGTGKEVMARTLHNKSPRANGPFMTVDCSVLPATLLESALFGHEKGAFTGAVESRQGLFRQADRGTLFLDEIHNIPVDLQSKLLRFLEEQTLIPVGGNKPVKLDVRILLATNVDLEELVRQGRFREDLFYRIAVLTLRLPPLRERLEDIPLLAAHFLEGFNRKLGKAVRTITPASFRSLYDYPWPGNVRELKNVLERAHVFCEGTEIGEDLIRLEGPRSEGKPGKARKPMRVIRSTPKEMVSLIKRHQGHIRRVATELNVTRQTLYAFFRRHAIRPGDFR